MDGGRNVQGSGLWTCVFCHWPQERPERLGFLSLDLCFLSLAPREAGTSRLVIIGLVFFSPAPGEAGTSRVLIFGLVFFLTGPMRGRNVLFHNQLSLSLPGAYAPDSYRRHHGEVDSYNRHIRKLDSTPWVYYQGFPERVGPFILSGPESHQMILPTEVSHRQCRRPPTPSRPR